MEPTGITREPAEISAADGEVRGLPVVVPELLDVGR
jgi:hypothetical protein